MESIRGVLNQSGLHFTKWPRGTVYEEYWNYFIRKGPEDGNSSIVPHFNSIRPCSSDGLERGPHKTRVGGSSPSRATDLNIYSGVEQR